MAKLTIEVDNTGSILEQVVKAHAPSTLPSSLLNRVAKGVQAWIDSQNPTDLIQPRAVDIEFAREFLKDLEGFRLAVAAKEDDYYDKRAANASRIVEKSR